MLRIPLVLLALLFSADPCEARCWGRRKCSFRPRLACKSFGYTVSKAPVARNEYPRVTDVQTAWQDADGEWKLYGENDAIWVDLLHRHICVLEPNDFSQVRLIRFLKRPWGQPDAAWIEFGRANDGVSWTENSIEDGHWMVSIEVHFRDGTIRSLHETSN